ncbi:TldD/PmbA family protein [Meiothermus ruber]|jgi:PmbA protein|uniref:Peptidase U62 modulator of DNA gyrase n=1 Tax=Meiothermus ruber (strain ATCC 35948 / DSM 1279 / VKM B-1258 / 21) TaxID=504728 RepID=D3PLP2_MEIRD|nr:TldD/PmbA family protein [Meiothermus ruber]ADD29133.1 peptidase U62 modulator of DNA gyrase [Meiothermus ruber DSM 1279]AGK05416.1 peptidase U62 modulator of DNA gyrase [Meiothermus ruber DSM 1279]MCL6528533.1 TldD/PmbA family protein [Meiothermus ruber]
MTFEEARDYLLQKARALGLEAEVLATHTRELTIQAHGGKVEEITQATQGGVGVRVVVEGKTGYAYTEERTPEALDWVLQEAHENALLQSETGGFLPAGGALGQHDLLGEGLSAPLEQKRQAALNLEATLRADPRVRQVQMTRYSENETQATLGSTQGVSGAFRNGYALLLTSAVMGEGHSLKQGYEFDLSKEFHALEPGRTAQQFLHRTGRLLGARPLKTGRYKAYFEPKAFAQLLGMMGWFLLSAKNVLEGKSLLAGRVGQKIASELFTLVDDPTLPDGLASRPFDAEGTAARRTVFIEKGILRTFAHNSETARKMGVENTGHAARNYKGVLGIAPSNLFVEPGAGVQMDSGIVVTDLMGLHAGANPISGEFSLQALGLKVEGGEVAHPVENFTVAGNFLELLNRITALGSELEWNPMMGIVGSPMVEVAELSFAGA